MSLVARAGLQMLALLAFLGAVLFLPAGTVRYPAAWAYLAVFGGASVAVTAYLMLRDRGLLERRLALAEKGEQQRAQKIIQAITGPSFFAMFVVAGLDRRFGWSSVPEAAWIVADVLVAAAFLVIFFVFRENSYTSAIVEVGASQKVVSSGPYRVVRHPMYSGGLLLIAATPIALGSYWSELFFLPLLGAIVVRLLDEERLLAAQLDGYAAYLQKTRWRLLPGMF